jgi:hypothetical protein
MTLRSPWFFRIFSLSLLLSTAPAATLAAGNGDDREALLSFAQGDVRLSRGNGKHPDLNKTWESSQLGEHIEQGFALSTGDGRAEISFEDGSSVFLAENSLLLFTELSATGNRLITRMTLPTGTATFALRPLQDEKYFIQTPTDLIELSPRSSYFFRVDAYLDITALTPQGHSGESVSINGRVQLQAAKERTVFTRAGTIVPRSGLSAGSDAHADWDAWASARVREEDTVMFATMKGLGLSSPIPGITGPRRQGAFFDCGEFGTCWEPAPAEAQTDAALESRLSGAESHAPSQSPPGSFQSQTVTWSERSGAVCGQVQSRQVSRVAHNPQELQELLRQKQLAESSSVTGGYYSSGCYSGYWFHYRGHYVRLIKPRVTPRCPSADCKPKVPPRPVWVRAGRQTGFVPRHPDDMPGKPPINLKNGIFVPPTKPGDRPQLLAVDSSQKVNVLHAEPKEIQTEFSPQARAVPAPEIRAHLFSENTLPHSSLDTNHSPVPIKYDYKTHNFVMPRASAPGAPSKFVAVGGISSYGRAASFADGHSSTYAESFSHTSAASSYGGSHGSSYSGGGHASGSYSGGGTSGSSFSGGASGHSAGGGGAHSGGSSPHN